MPSASQAVPFGEAATSLTAWEDSCSASGDFAAMRSTGVDRSLSTKASEVA